MSKDRTPMSLEIAHQQAMETLEAAESLCDYAEHIEFSLTQLLDGSEVMLVFPTVADLHEKGTRVEHTVKVYVDSDFLVSCCGTNPELILHRLFRWVEAMFDTDEEYAALA